MLANVTEVKDCYITTTTRGRLYFPLYVLDIPLSSGTYVEVTGLSLNYQHSVLYHNSAGGEVIGTDFVTEGNEIIGTFSGDAPRYLLGFPTTRGSASFGAIDLGSCVYFGHTIIKGSNDVYAAVDYVGGPQSYLNITEPHVVYTANTFGNFGSIYIIGTTDLYVTLDDTNMIQGGVIGGLLGDAEDSDPYEAGGSSGEGGGTGNFDFASDPVTWPDLPSLSAVDTGFITLFNPSLTQLKALSSYMWSNDLFNIDTWKKIVNDPMDAIIGLSIVPVAVPDGGLSDVTVGNILTSVSMTKAASQYVIVDCGTLNINEAFGGCLDYDPYTKSDIYLPFCGTHALKVDDIMGKSVQVKYYVDILSGACVAMIMCGGTILYSFIGQCSSSIPITGSDMTQVINGVLGIAGSIGSMVATGGMSAPLTLAEGVNAAASTASNIMGMKPNIEKSGSMSGTGGMMAIKKPYITLTRPRQCLPSKQNVFMGYPSYITKKLNDITGYTIVEEVHLEGIPATDAEKKEIEQLLKGGVIL